MKPTFITHQAPFEYGTCYSIMESNGDAFAQLLVLHGCIHFREYDVWLENFHVSPEVRQQRYATAILELIKTLAPADLQMATYVIDDAPDWHINFFEKHGVVIANKDSYKTNSDDYLD